MEMKWKVYFTIVGIAALLMVGYETNVWANLTSSKSDTQVERIENPKVKASDITPLEEKLKEQVAGGEFTVINKDKDMNSSEVVKEEDQEETGIIPANIQIPAIDVNSEIESVGVLDNGQMGVPEDPDKAGWFEPGTEPGNVGNSVIAGHVDSRTGPAVFYDLDKLEKGDEIIVTDKNGEKKTYVVQKLESYPENDSPISRIFGPTDERRLNLITCTGEFIRDQGGHQDRLVVYSILKEPEKKKSDIKAPANVEVNGTLVTWYAVREDYVAGYRVYRSKNGEEFEKVASISNHERKSYADSEVSQYKYYVTTVDLEGNESEPSKTVPTSK
ncbi:sortase domain-containing protein [Halobacillus sp. K22]|uniref:class F sortase n=1 Tax=Halobacillus sp. K22 TaxID=3457431 RepID=UPI003FCC30A8